MPKPTPHTRSGYKHFLTLPTRWADNDVYGHVNNSVYYFYFDTVVNKPGDNYRESSATALIAAGWLNAVNKGYLDDQYLQPALNEFKAVVDNLRIDDNKAYMTEISLWTIPMFLMPYKLKYGPYPGYKYVKKGENISYGVASLIMAAINSKPYL